MSETVNVPRMERALAVATARDVSVFQVAGLYLVAACDSLGAIGRKPADVVSSPEAMCGSYTLRVCLNELAAVGASPVLVMSLVCNEWEPTGREILESIRTELDAEGYTDVAITGSTEENMPTTMTGLGIAVLGTAPALRWRRTRPGDSLVLVGHPWVGQEVLEHGAELLTPAIVRSLVTDDAVDDFLPCGSRGIAHEVDVLERETGMKVLLDGCWPYLTKSAGPATCGIMTVHQPVLSTPLELTRLGSIGQAR